MRNIISIKRVFSITDLSYSNLNKKTTYKYSLIAFFAIAGLFGSLTHYHSEGLECLDHAEEQHYVQNEIFCPICTLVVFGDFETNLTSEAYLYNSIFETFYSENFSSEDLDYSKQGRAPPFLA